MSYTGYLTHEGFDVTWSEGHGATATIQAQAPGGRWTMFICPMDRTAAAVYGVAFGSEPYTDEDCRAFNHDPGSMRIWDLNAHLVSWLELNGQPQNPRPSVVTTLVRLTHPWENDDKGFRAETSVSADHIQGLLGCSEDDAGSMHRALAHFYEYKVTQEGWGLP